MPRRSWSGLLQLERKEAEQLGFWAARSKRNPDAARRLYDTPSTLQETQANAGDLALSQGMPGRDVITDIQQQPVGGGVQNEAELIGKRRAAAGAVRSGLRFVLLDQILGLPARAIDRRANCKTFAFARRGSGFGRGSAPVLTFLQFFRASASILDATFLWLATVEAEANCRSAVQATSRISCSMVNARMPNMRWQKTLA